MFEFFKKLFDNKEIEIEENPMKYLIAGLGNIGSKYHNTRHNIGFDVVDALAKEKGGTFKEDNQAHTCTVKHKGRALILIKPTTYMNLSGKAIRYWMTKHKIKSENLLVIVDDLNLDFGSIRIRAKGKDGGHNGLKNIQNIMQTQQYARLRMGIGDSFSKGKQVNFVLGEWNKKEQEELGEFIDRACRATLDFTSIPIGQVMTRFNGKG